MVKNEETEWHVGLVCKLDGADSMDKVQVGPVTGSVTCQCDIVQPMHPPIIQ